MTEIAGQTTEERVRHLQRAEIARLWPDAKGGPQGTNAKARQIAKEVGETVGFLTGIPTWAVTPTVRFVLETAGANVRFERRGKRTPRLVEQPTKRLVGNPTSVGQRTNESVENPTNCDRPHLDDADKKQALDLMCRLAGCTPLKLGQTLVEREIAKLANPSSASAWIEGGLSKSIGRQVTVGAIRRAT